MKKTIKIAMIASVIFALTIFLFLQEREVTRPMVVARQDIPAGTVISAEMLRTERIPAVSALVAGVASAQAEVIGKTVTIGRAKGDLIPLSAVGRERQSPQPGNGFITITAPIEEATGVVFGDVVAIIVFDHAGEAQLLEGFMVVGQTAAGRETYLTLEAGINDLLQLAPALSSRAFKIVRRS